MSSTTYTVTGMTCQHCVASVTEEISEIPGVESVDVVLETGQVTVHGEGVTQEAVAAAVDEAGFTLA